MRLRVLALVALILLLAFATMIRPRPSMAQAQGDSAGSPVIDMIRQIGVAVVVAALVGALSFAVATSGRFARLESEVQNVERALAETRQQMREDFKELRGLMHGLKRHEDARD